MTARRLPGGGLATGADAVAATLARGGGAAGAGACAPGFAALAPPAVAAGFTAPSAASSTTTRSPADTFAPVLIATDTTVPALGEGTSIVALSVSSVMSGSSAAIAWPGFTCTSMTSTAPK